MPHKKRFFVADVDAHRIETWHAKREHAVAQQNELFHAVPDKNWGVVDTQRVGFDFEDWDEVYPDVACTYPVYDQRRYAKQPHMGPCGHTEPHDHD